jgi:hypothetical protein
MTQEVLLGFEIGSGSPVTIPLSHLAVTGQTQLSGKTTTLEALVERCGHPAIAFVTKRAEGSFTRGRSVKPFFRERADWQFVSSVLEATLRERLKFERSWIMRACKGAKTLSDVQRNVRRGMDKARGLAADVLLTLDHYLDIVIPQIERLPYADRVDLVNGLNVMDLSAYSLELQGLVIQSVLQWVYENCAGTLVIIPEAWEFIPQQRGSPVLLACETLIRKGGNLHNYVWLDSQDIAGVHKNILRQVAVWILGVQREANEVKRALAHIPGNIRKPKLEDVMQLDRGQFFACFGKTVVKVYVQPAWLDDVTAAGIAAGIIKRAVVPPKREAEVDENEARRLREENEQLKRRVATLEGRIAQAVEERRPPDPLLSDGYPQLRGTPAKVPATPHAPPAVGAASAPSDVESERFRDALYFDFRRRILEDPIALATLSQSVPSIEVTRTVEKIRLDYATQPGFLAALIAQGFFGLDTPVRPAEVIAELKRRGRSVHPANVSRDLGRLTEQGFLTREADGYRAVPGMKVHIVEAA